MALHLYPELGFVHSVGLCVDLINLLHGTYPAFAVANFAAIDHRVAVHPRRDPSILAGNDVLVPIVCPLTLPHIFKVDIHGLKGFDEASSADQVGGALGKTENV